MRAVGGDQVVLVAHRADGADDRRLLADREVQEAADLRLRVHLARALLEAADEHHRLEPLARGVAVRQLPLLGSLLLLLRDVCHGAPGTLAVDPPRLPLPYQADAHAHVLGRIHRLPGRRMAADRPSAAVAVVGAARARRVGPGDARGAPRRASARRGCSARCPSRRGSSPSAPGGRGPGGSGSSRWCTASSRARGGCEVAVDLIAPRAARARRRRRLRPGDRPRRCGGSPAAPRAR